jgi:hypothetical protein
VSVVVGDDACAGQHLVVSSSACIRWSAAAMSAKSPAPSRKGREKDSAPAFVWGERMGQPPSCSAEKKGWASPPGLLRVF